MSDDSIVDIADAIIVIGPSPSKKMLGALLSTILLSSIVLGFAMDTNHDVNNGTRYFGGSNFFRDLPTFTDMVEYLPESKFLR